MRVWVWLALALWATLVGVAILAVDGPVATFSHDVLARPRWSVWLTWIADMPYWTAVFAWPFAGLWRLSGRRLAGGMAIALRASIAVLLAVVAVVLLKDGFGRTWPETWVDGNPSWIRDHVMQWSPLHGGLGWRSFPSGHMARIVAPLAVLWWRVPRARALWVLPPLLVMIGLLAADYHFVSDCLAGALLGFVLGTLVAGRRRPAVTDWD